MSHGRSSDHDSLLKHVANEKRIAMLSFCHQLAPLMRLPIHSDSFWNILDMPKESPVDPPSTQPKGRTKATATTAAAATPLVKRLRVSTPRPRPPKKSKTTPVIITTEETPSTPLTTSEPSSQSVSTHVDINTLIMRDLVNSKAFLAVYAKTIEPLVKGPGKITPTAPIVAVVVEPAAAVRVMTPVTTPIVVTQAAPRAHPVKTLEAVICNEMAKHESLLGKLLIMSCERARSRRKK